VSFVERSITLIYVPILEGPLSEVSLYKSVVMITGNMAKYDISLEGLRISTSKAVHTAHVWSARPVRHEAQDHTHTQAHNFVHKGQYSNHF